MTHEERKYRRKRIAEFISEGGTLVGAAETFRVGVSICRLACEEFGIEIPKKAKAPKVPTAPGSTLARNTYKIIGILCNTDETMHSIAHRICISYQRVAEIYQKCLEENIPVRQRKRGRPLNLGTLAGASYADSATVEAGEGS